MSRLLKLGAAVGLVVVGLVVGAQLGQAPVAQSASAGSPSGGFALARPAFAQTVARTFLDDEAGISVYLKLDQTIDLAKVRGLYRVIEDETETYLIGTIPSVGTTPPGGPTCGSRRTGGSSPTTRRLSLRAG